MKLNINDKRDCEEIAMISEYSMAKGKAIWIFTVGILFLNCIILSYLLGISDMVHDSGYYWSIADSTLENGIFNITNYPETYRGCLFPLLILIVKSICNGVWGWRILSSVMIASCFGVIFPLFFNSNVITVRKMLRAILTEVIFLYVWGNYIQYSLSDFVAFYFFLVAITIDKIIIEDNKDELQNTHKKVKNSILWVISGIFYYAAYNTRVVYVYAIFIVIIYLFFALKKNLNLIFVTMVLILLGAFVCSIPQCIVNSQYVAFSPKVYTEQSTDYAQSLQERQVFWGLTIQRYETYVGDEYPWPAIIFNDAAGKKISALEKLEIDEFSFGDLFRIAAKRPLDLIGIYTRHFISLATPAWNEVYIRELYTNKNVLVILSIVTWFIAAIAFFMKINQKNRYYYSDLLVIAMFLPGILQLFGAPN